ncbi:ankyrin repeat-containing domain protein [Hypoxylon sp. FL1284]|nr:ankyrin repeat-containing domain protein [Hypoxylon sp. FL1284]
MEFNVQMPNDAIERRRLQNRIAQRKFRQKRGQRRATAVGDGVPGGLVPSLAVDASDSQAINPSHEFSSSAPAFPSDAGASQIGIAGITPPDLDNVGYWNLGATDDFLSGADPALTLDGVVTSPSQFLQDLQADLTTPASTTLVASTMTDETHVSPASGPDRSNPAAQADAEEEAVVRRPLRWRRSAQLREGQDPAQQSDAGDEGWLGSLHIAAAKGLDRMVQVLLQRRGGAGRDERDSDGRTPLMHAVIRGHEPVVRTLLAHGARLAPVDRDARSALHWAALYRRDGLLRVLLERRGGRQRRRGEGDKDDGGEGDDEDVLDINAYDDSGWTPLHIAIYQDSEAAVCALLDAGACLDYKAHKCPLSMKLVVPPLTEVA